MNTQFLLYQKIAASIPATTPQSRSGNMLLNTRTLRCFMVLFAMLLIAGSGLELNAQSFSATLSSNQRFYRPSPGSSVCGGTWGTFTSISGQSSTYYSYATQSFTVSTAGDYTITVTSSSAIDPMLLVYTSFSPSSPTNNFKVGDDDSGGSLLPKIGGCANHFAAGTYTIVVTSYRSSTTSGTVYFTISGAGATTVLPTVSTNSASSITSNSVVLGGNVTADGGATVSARGVAWGTSSNPTSGTSMGSGTGSFSQTISGLTPGTTYYARAYATNSVGTAYGPQVTFTTQNYTPPSVTTNSTSNIEISSATFNGNVTNTGGQNVSRGFQFSTNSSFSGATTRTLLGTQGTGAFSYNENSLVGSTLYYVRALATNDGGTTYGSSTSFYTKHTVTYSANANGSISGSNTQSISHNGSTSAVTAVPNAGYHFLRWSDNSTANPRTDANVTSSFSRSATFDVNRLEFTSQPGNTVAGDGINFTVRIRDSYGNTMINSDRTITVALASNPAGGTLAGTLTASAVDGVATFTLPYIEKTGVYTFTVSASDLTSATSNSFTIIPAALSYFTVDNVVSPHEAGTFTSPRVMAYDIFDNIKTNYTGTITFSTNNVSMDEAKPTVLPVEYTFLSSDNGIKTFTNGVSLKQTSFSNNGNDFFVKVQDGAAGGQQDDIEVTPAPIRKYTLVANPDIDGNQQAITAGITFDVLAIVYDEYDNIKSDYDGSNDVMWVSNATSSPRGNPRVMPANGPQEFTEGVATVSGFTFYNAQEAPTITITDGPTSSPGTTDPIEVLNHNLHNFQLETYTTDDGWRTVDEYFSVKVTARDQYHNIARDYAGSIRFKSSDDDVFEWPAGMQSFAPASTYAGIRDFENLLKVSKIGAYWLRAGDAQFPFIVGDETDIVIFPGAFAPGELEINPDVESSLLVDHNLRIAGQYVDVTLTPRDQYGNLLCTCRDIKVFLNGSQNHRAGAGNTNELIEVANNGDGTYTALVRVTEVGENIISATFTADEPGAEPIDFTQTQTITVEAAPPSLAHTTIDAEPNTITTDETSLVTIQLKDQFDNNRITDDGVITLSTTLGHISSVSYISGGMYTATLTPTYSVAPTNGVGTANITGSIIFNETAGPGYWESDPWPSDGDIVDSDAVTINEGLPNLAQSTLTNNAALDGDQHWMTTDDNALVSLQLKDHLGNLIVNNRGTVTLTTDLGGFGDNTGLKTVEASYSGSGTYSASLYAFTDGINGTGLATIDASLTGAHTTGTDGAFTEETEIDIREGLPALATITIDAAENAITADETTLLTVQLKDHLGNLIVNNRGTVTLTTDQSWAAMKNLADSQGSNGSFVEADYAEDGKYTATLTITDLGLGDVTINGQYNGDPITDSDVVTFTHGVSTQLAIITQPSAVGPAVAGHAIAGVDFNEQPVIHILDQWGNLVTTGDGSTANVSATRNTGTADLQGTATVSASAGIATFTNLSYLKAENIDISFSSGALTAATSEEILVVHNIPDYMVIAIDDDNHPKDGSDNYMLEAGQPQTIHIRAYDEYGNLATRFGGTKELMFDGAGVSPAPPYYGTVNTEVFGALTNLSFTEGVATADMILYLEEITLITADHVDAAYSDIYVNGALDIEAVGTNGLPVNVQQSAPAYLAITIENGIEEVVAGETYNISITAYDHYNNPATDFTGEHTLKFSGANDSDPVSSLSPTINGIALGTDTPLTFSEGSVSVPMVLYKVEDVSIAAVEQLGESTGISTSFTHDGTDYDYELELGVVNAPAAYLALTHGATGWNSGTMTAGTNPEISISAYDAFNNPALDYTGTHSLVFSGADCPVDHPYFCTLPEVMNSADDYVTFGAATTLNFTTGVATTNMKLYVAESNLTIDAVEQVVDGISTDINIGGDDHNYGLPVNVVHNTPFRMGLTIAGNLSEVEAGVPNDITLKVYDEWNNLAIGYTDNHDMAFTGAAVSPLPSTSPTVAGTDFTETTTLVFTAGSVTASMILYKAETGIEIIATEIGGNAITTPANMEVGGVTYVYRLPLNAIHTDPDYLHLTIAGDVGSVVAGVGHSITLRAYDVYNNLATGYDGEKAITFDGALPSPAYDPYPAFNPKVEDVDFGSATTLSFDAGQLTANMILYKEESVTITATDNTINTKFINVDGTDWDYRLHLDVLQAAANYLAITGNSTQQAGAIQTITITAFDAWNNLATEYTGAKDLVLSGANPSPDPVNQPTFAGTAFGASTSRTFSSGVTTGALRLYKTELAVINVSDGSIDSDNGTNSHSLEVLVGPTALRDFAVSGVENPHYYGEIQSVTVEALDTYGNRKTNYDGRITFSLTDFEATAPDDYFFTVGEGMDNGIKTFENSIRFAQTSYYSQNQDGWWVTVVDWATGTRFGAQGDIIVLPRPIIITADNRTKNWYGEDYVLGTTLFTVEEGIEDLGVYPAEWEGLTENITSVDLNSDGTAPTATVGSYPIATSNATGTGGFDPNYYNIEYSDAGQLTVTKRPITIATTGSQSKTYGDTDPGSYGFAVTSAVNLTTWDQWDGVLTRASGEDVDLYDILFGGSSLTIVETANPGIDKADNYDITFVNENQFEIIRRAITVTPDATQHKTYGDLDPVYAYTTADDAIGSTLPNGHLVALTGALSREPGEIVNTYKILQGNIDNTQNPNYDITFTEDVLFTINRLPIQVTADAGQTKIYGQLDLLPFTYTADPAIDHELANGLVVALDGTLTRAAGENVGLYAIEQNTVNNSTNTNYDVTFVSNDFEITRLDIALTPDAGQKKIYGDADPLPFTYTTDPAIGHELDNGINVALTGTLTREAGEIVSFYNILQGDIDNTENPNYNLSFTENVKFEIERKAIAINVTANQSKEYGDSDPVYTYATVPVEGELPFNAEFIGALVRASGENVATDYTITQGSLELEDDNNATTSLAQNYNVTFNSADFAITRKAIEITVTSGQQKVYGESDPVFTFTTDPALASLPFQAASWTGALVRETGEVVSDTYTINQGSLELVDEQNASGGSLATNYTVTFNTADFEITRKPITITVDADIAKIYGDNDPAFTFTSDPALIDLPFEAEWLGNMERINDDNNVGTYTITQGTLELNDDNNNTTSLAQNYSLTFNTDVLTINKRNITITVDANQNKVYAETDPVFSYSSTVDPLYYSGSFNGVLTRAAGENVADNYTISRGTLQVVDVNNSESLDNNYNLSFVPANFEITKKPITITVVAGQNKRYGFADPTSNPTAPTYFRAFEFESSVNPLPFAGDFTGTLERTGVSSSPVGLYAISRGSLQLADENLSTSLDDNYDLTFVADNFEITERLITITADNREKTYGDVLELGNTQFGITGDGMAYVEEINTVVLTSDGTAEYADTGSYPIHTASAVGSVGYNVSNYDITYSTDGILTVNTRPLSLFDFAAANKVYDGNTSIIGTGFFDNRKPGDQLAFTFNANFSDANAGLNKQIDYTAVQIAGGADQFNYHLADGTDYINATQADITPKAAIITPDDIHKPQGILYEFTGNEFTAAGFVGEEGAESVDLHSDGATALAPEDEYDIVITDINPIAGTLLSNYAITEETGTMYVGDGIYAGYLRYYVNGSEDMAMPGATITVVNDADVVLGSVITDHTGYFIFTDVEIADIASIEVSTDLAWGGVTAIDALAMELREIGQAPAYWTPLGFIDRVADVSANGILDAQDVLQVKQRILQPLTYYFDAGNWAFYAEKNGSYYYFDTDMPGNPNKAILDVTEPGNVPTLLLARTFGDVDGDYDPNPIRDLNPMPTDDVMFVEMGAPFDLPVRFASEIHLGAISLELHYNSDLIEFMGLQSALQGLQYSHSDGVIRTVWTDMSGELFAANDALMMLQLRSIGNIEEDDVLFYISDKSTFGTTQATAIEGVELLTYAVDNVNVSIADFFEQNSSMEAYPNPFMDNMTISYELAIHADVSIEMLDMKGVVIRTFADREHSSGKYSISFEPVADELAAGAYYLRLTAKTQSDKFVKYVKVVYLK